MTHELSLVIPVFNEASEIRDTVTEALDVLRNIELTAYELVVVDDGSSDGSGDKVINMEHVRVIRHPCNAGYGRALKTGMSAAAHDTILICDADLTYPLYELPRLLLEYSKGFDMVVGARTGDAYRESFIKSPLRSLLKWLVEFTSGRRPIPDVNSGFRLFDRRTAMRYEAHLCNTFSFTTSLTLAYEMTGKFTKYVPIEYRFRHEKTKIRLFRDSLRTAQYIIQAAIYYNPLKIFILLAAGCLGVAFVGFLGSAILGLKSGFLVGVGATVLSVLVFVLGFLAVLLKQIMDNPRLDGNKTNAQ